MDSARKEIEALIPHRSPFLFVDRIIQCDTTTIVTETTFSADLPFYQGHYPGNPITPGVLLSEAVFQSGALLIAKTAEKNELENGIPVLTRIVNAKYKRSVFPGEDVSITVSLVERLATVWFLKGVIKKAGKTAVQIEFACTLAPKER